MLTIQVPNIVAKLPEGIASRVISLLKRVLTLGLTPAFISLCPAFADSSPQFAYCGIGSLSAAMDAVEQNFSAICNNPDSLDSCIWKNEIFTSEKIYGSYEQGWITYVIGYGSAVNNDGGWSFVYCADPTVKDSGSPDCPNKIGNPVNSGTGNKHQNEADISGSNLTFARIYNSNPGSINNNFGKHWQHSYAEQLKIDIGNKKILAAD